MKHIKNYFVNIGKCFVVSLVLVAAAIATLVCSFFGKEPDVGIDYEETMNNGS